MFFFSYFVHVEIMHNFSFVLEGTPKKSNFVLNYHYLHSPSQFVLRMILWFICHLFAEHNFVHDSISLC